jgi:asparagine synthase (glutamine-hydrolysing)
MPIQPRLKPIDGVNVSQFSDETLRKVLLVKEGNNSFVPVRRLFSLVNAVGLVEKRGVTGIFIEAGVALGGSAALIADAMSSERQLFLYDVFDMIPPPQAADGERAKAIYDQFLDDLDNPTHFYTRAVAGKDMIAGVVSLVKELARDRIDNVHCIKGLVENTFSVSEPVAFAHIDLDWYGPTSHVLDRLLPNLAVGGIVIIDDFSYWDGCRDATLKSLSKMQAEFHFNSMFGHLIVERVRC